MTPEEVIVITSLTPLTMVVPSAASADGRPLSAVIESSLDQDQAADVVVVDLAGKSSIADLMVIATGRSSRHLGAMAENLRDRLRTAGFGGVEIEGLTQGDWVLVDAGDVIVHLFRPEVRVFYNLEKLWGLEAARARVAAGN